MAMSIECRNALGMRRNATNVPETSVTATLMRIPNASAWATAAPQASEAARAEITKEGTASEGCMRQIRMKQCQAPRRRGTGLAGPLAPSPPKRRAAARQGGGKRRSRAGGSGHHAQEGVVELAVMVENAASHFLPAPGD